MWELKPATLLVISRLKPPTIAIAQAITVIASATAAIPTATAGDILFPAEEIDKRRAMKFATVISESKKYL